MNRMTLSLSAGNLAGGCSTMTLHGSPPHQAGTLVLLALETASRQARWPKPW